MRVDFIEKRKDRGVVNNRTYLYPGSFNPFHMGHARIAHHAANMVQDRVSLEISLLNPDKPNIDFAEMQRRIRSVDNSLDWKGHMCLDRIYVTKVPFFTDKIDLFSPVTFVVGVDTFNRIFNPIYYRGSNALELLEEKILATETKFLVFNRKKVELHKSLLYKGFYNFIPYENCPDCGISSTEIRKNLLTH